MFLMSGVLNIALNECRGTPVTGPHSLAGSWLSAGRLNALSASASCFSQAQLANSSSRRAGTWKLIPATNVSARRRAVDSTWVTLPADGSGRTPSSGALMLRPRSRFSPRARL